MALFINIEHLKSQLTEQHEELAPYLAAKNGSSVTIPDYEGPSLILKGANLAYRIMLGSRALDEATAELDTTNRLVCAEHATHERALGVLRDVHDLRKSGLFDLSKMSDLVSKALSAIGMLKRSKAWPFTEAAKLHESASSSIYLCFNKETEHALRTNMTSAISSLVRIIPGSTLDAVGRRVNVFVTDISKLGGSDADQCQIRDSAALYSSPTWKLPEGCNFGKYIRGSIVIDSAQPDPGRLFVHELTHLVHFERIHVQEVKRAYGSLNYPHSLFMDIVNKNKKRTRTDEHAAASVDEFIAKLGEWYFYSGQLDSANNRQFLEFIDGKDIVDKHGAEVAMNEVTERKNLLKSSIQTILAVK
jgi:hypothetical protein